MTTLLENIIWFVFVFFMVYGIFYYYIVKQGLACRGVKAPALVCILLYGYDIVLEKINYKKMLIELDLVTSFTIAFVSTICFYLIESVLIAAILILIMSLSICLIFYNLIGRRYEKLTKEHLKNENKEIVKEYDLKENKESSLKNKKEGIIEKSAIKKKNNVTKNVYSKQKSTIKREKSEKKKRNNSKVEKKNNKKK